MRFHRTRKGTASRGHIQKNNKSPRIMVMLKPEEFAELTREAQGRQAPIATIVRERLALSRLAYSPK